MLEAFLLISCVVYLLEYVTFYVGVIRSYRWRRVVPDTYPMISVVVAARNEAANIERCLNALIAQDYPPERMQIVAINDDSEDETLALMRGIAAAHPGRIEIVSTVEEKTHARGKARAIAQGMDYATGEIILLTDADCIPPKPWARSVVEHFLPGVDAYGGFTLIETHDFFSAIQQLDWMHLQTLSSAALTFDIPVGIIGNNFAFRREAYDSVGGYRTVYFSITEDFALFRTMHAAGRKVIYPCTHDTSMRTHPCRSMFDVLRQKQRWAYGGLETGPRGYAIVVIALLMMVAMILAPFVSTGAWIGVWGTKFLCDLMVMIPNARALRRLGPLLRYFLLFEFYFIAQAVVAPILLLNPVVVWKGREYRYRNKR